MEVLSSRVLLRPVDPRRSREFYQETLGLAVYREFGSGPGAGTVFFLGGGYLELSGQAEPPATGAGSVIPQMSLWIQVRDVHAVHERLRDRGARVLQPPRLEPWGLIEMWAADPDGVRIVLVEIPADHPLRRDTRASPG